MDDGGIDALEAAIAGLGVYLVQMDKFRAARESQAGALRVACLAIGDRARRAHRHGRLDGPLVRELAEDVAAAAASLCAWLFAVRGSPAHRAAVAALRVGDDTALRALLPDLFAGVAVVEPPPALFHSVAWQRRGRPRPAQELADTLARLREEGIVGDGDAEAPGVDPDLPGVLLHQAPPPGAPIYLTLRGAARPTWVLLLSESGDVVVPGVCTRLRFSVGLADAEDEELDAWALDPAAYRGELEAALRRAGLPVDHTPGD